MRATAKYRPGRASFAGVSVLSRTRCAPGASVKRRLGGDAVQPGGATTVTVPGVAASGRPDATIASTRYGPPPRTNRGRTWTVTGREPNGAAPLLCIQYGE